MIKLYNTLSRQLEVFEPRVPGRVSMYVCGPTVYDRPHLGNARSAVSFDVLHRLLRHTYDVNYVRNITDVDDKIMIAAEEQNIPIDKLTQETTTFYHEDMDALGVLRPTHEPCATHHIADMIALIERLLAQSHAYAAEGHVLFDTVSDPNYGALSRQPLDEMIAGARVEVAPYKKNPQDFVLWKPSTPEQPGWESPWGRGRPGWHIECSAMIAHHFGPAFDIHGGGQDLIFPHHENEIAQSTCAFGSDTFARYWLHNGMLLVQGTKMSKSLGNFRTVLELRQQAKGETIRFAFLSTHYRQPLDWQEQTLPQAKAGLDRLYTALKDTDIATLAGLEALDHRVLEALSADLNTPLAIQHLHDLASQVHKNTSPTERLALQKALYQSAQFLGFFRDTPTDWFQGGTSPESIDIEDLIQQRKQARQDKDFARADEIRQQLLDHGIILEDGPSGTTWRRG